MGDWSHPEAVEIKEKLLEVSVMVRGTGYEPCVSGVLHMVGDEEKGNALEEHSERLAIAYGLLKIKQPAPIRIMKNLRVCGDCHEVTKIISRVYDQIIIVGDRVQFHKLSTECALATIIGERSSTYIIAEALQSCGTVLIDVRAQWSRWFALHQQELIHMYPVCLTKPTSITFSRGKSPCGSSNSSRIEVAIFRPSSWPVLTIPPSFCAIFGKYFCFLV